jgi:hypothetical protein
VRCSRSRSTVSPRPQGWFSEAPAICCEVTESGAAFSIGTIFGVSQEGMETVLHFIRDPTEFLARDCAVESFRNDADSG